MGRLVAVESVTLDGVMQAPARPDEDPRDGFSRGGWAAPYADAELATIMARGFPAAEALLLGRRTYDDLASVWPYLPADNPYTEVINNIRKYVASTTLEEPLAWNNSILLGGDAVKAVAGLKAELAKDLVVLGSGELVASLMQHALVDAYTLLIHPLVLGQGRQLFRDGGLSADLRLIEAQTTGTGVLIATYAANRR